jgi:DNA-binding CsgD family transcriptional regulator
MGADAESNRTPYTPTPADDLIATEEARRAVRNLLKAGKLKASQLGEFEDEVKRRLLHSLPKYDPSRDIGVGAYLGGVARIAARNILSETMARRRGRPTVFSLDHSAVDTDGGRSVALIESIPDDRAGRAVELSALISDLGMLLPRLTDRERRICERFLAGDTQEEAAQNLGIHRRTMAGYIKQMVPKFEDAGMRGYLGGRAH